MPLTIPNLRFIYKEGESDSLVTTRVDGADEFIEEIESLESTGISATQTTQSSQPLYDSGIIKALDVPSTYMTLPSSINLCSGANDKFVIAMRIQVHTGSTTAKLINNRNDDANFNIRYLRISNEDKLRFFVGSSSSIHTTPGDFQKDQWITFAIKVDREADEAKILFEDESMVTATGLGTSTLFQENRIFGANNESNSGERSFSHVFIAQSYPDDQSFQDLFDWVKAEMPVINTYATDFSEYTSNQQPSDWTRRGVANFTWEVEDDVNAIGGKIIRGFTEAGNDRNGLTWDEIDGDPDRDNVETLMRVRFPDSLSSAEVLALLRGSGTDGTDINMYRHGARPNQANSKISLEKYVNGSFGSITSTDQITYEIGKWYWIRARANGSDQFVKVWPASEDEPVSWTLTDIDTDITGVGWTGIFRFQTDPIDIDFFSVGTNGETAPSPETFTLSTNTTGNGSISIDPDKTGFNENEEVELTAVPDSGWIFDHWEDDLTGSTNPDTITIDSDKTVTAVFTEEFEFLSPTEGATNIPATLDASINNPSGYGHINIRINDDDNDSPDEIVRDKIIQNGDPIEYSLPISEQLDYLTKYHAIAQQFTPGSLPTGPIFSENFVDDDQAGWPNWTTQTLSGSGSHKIESNRGVQVVDANTVVVADLDGHILEDFDLTIRFNASDISGNVQPSIHFATQGDWLPNNHIEGFYVFWNGDSFELGRVITNPHNYSGQTLTLSRTIDEDVDIRILKEGLRIRIAAWISSSSQDGWDIDFEAPDPYFSGGFSVKTATTGSASNDSEVRYDLIEYSGVIPVPVINEIIEGETTADVNYTGVPFDNDGYEISLKEGEGEFTPPVDVGFDNPINIINLTENEDYEIRIRAVHNGIAGEWSEIASFSTSADSIDNITITPVNPQLSEAQGSTVTLQRELQTSGSPVTTGTWSLETGNTTGVTIQSQTDSQVTLVTDGNDSPNDTRAVRWTSDHDSSFEEVTLTIVESVVGSRAGDEEALVAIFNSTNGTSWNNTRNWNGSNMSLSNDIYGVYTDTIGGELRVTHIKLNGNESLKENTSNYQGVLGGNGLVGQLPSEINNLTECKYFNVKQNNLSGPIPTINGMVQTEELLLNGRVMDALFNLNTQHHQGKSPGGSWHQQRSNNFTGSCPNLSGMTKLKDIEIMARAWSGDEDGQRGLTGTMHSSWGNLPDLIVCSISRNSLEGDPVDMSASTNLRHYYNYGNIFNKGFYTWMENVPLAYIQIGHATNDFQTSVIPPFPGGELRLLTSSFSNLTGSIPPSVADGTNPNINILDFGFSPNMSGGIPAVGQNNLAAYTFRGSNLSGEIPDSFWSNSNGMINTNFEFNRFNGMIKDDADLTNLYRPRNFRFGDQQGSAGFEGAWPKVRWLQPSALKQFTIATFRNNHFIPDDWLMVDDGREYDESRSDKGDGTAIVQKTRIDWYRHHCGGETHKSYKGVDKQIFNHLPQKNSFGKQEDLQNGIIDFSYRAKHEDNRYQWYKDGQILEGETDNKIDTTQYGSGVYKLHLTNDNEPGYTFYSYDIIVN